MEVIKLSRIKSANHRQWISIDFGFDVADVEVGHFLIDDVIAAGGLWGDAISDVIGDVTDADLLAGPGRQFGRRPDGHLSDQSDVTGDVIAELLHAGQPLAAQVDVGGRDVTLDLLAIVQTFTLQGESEPFRFVIVEADVLHGDADVFRRLRVVHHPAERRHRIQRAADLGLFHEGSNAEVALGAVHFIGQSASGQ